MIFNKKIFYSIAKKSIPYKEIMTFNSIEIQFNKNFVEK